MQSQKSEAEEFRRLHREITATFLSSSQEQIPSGYVYGNVDSNASLSVPGCFSATGQTSSNVLLHNMICDSLFASTGKNFHYFGIGLEYDMWISSGNGFNHAHLFHFIFTLKGLLKSVAINLYIQ